MTRHSQKQWRAQRGSNSRDPFSLTPALSSGERVNQSRASLHSYAPGLFPPRDIREESDCELNDSLSLPTRHTRLPLPQGEGRGEGERRPIISAPPRIGNIPRFVLL